MYRLGLIYIIAFIEGLNLMCFELISSRTMTIGFGSTLTVWSILLSCTLLFLAFGYFLGGKLSTYSYDKISVFLYFYIFATSLFLFFYTNISNQLVNSFSISNSFVSMLLFTIILIGFPITLFGLVTPLVISLNDSKNEVNKGKVAGKIYAISTIGGVISTFLYGLYIIPIYGLQFSSITISGFLLLSIIIFIILQKTN
jgi:hypothetical protein